MNKPTHKCETKILGKLAMFTTSKNIDGKVFHCIENKDLKDFAYSVSGLFNKSNIYKGKSLTNQRIAKLKIIKHFNKRHNSDIEPTEEWLNSPMNDRERLEFYRLNGRYFNNFSVN